MIPCNLKYALVVVTAIIIIVGLSIWTGKRSPPSRVQGVVTRAAKLNTASHSNQDTMTSLLDVTAALATLNTAVELSGDEAVARATGVPIHTLEGEMMAHQRLLIRQLDTSLPPLPKI